MTGVLMRRDNRPRHQLAGRVCGSEDSGWSGASPGEASHTLRHRHAVESPRLAS